MLEQNQDIHHDSSFLKSVVIIKISCPRSLEQRNSSSFNVAVGAGRNIQNDIAVGGLLKLGSLPLKLMVSLIISSFLDSLKTRRKRIQGFKTYAFKIYLW